MYICVSDIFITSLVLTLDCFLVTNGPPLKTNPKKYTPIIQNNIKQEIQSNL